MVGTTDNSTVTLNATGTNPWSYGDLSGAWVSGNTYTVTAIATDNAGNTTNPATNAKVTFSSDITPPTVTIHDVVTTPVTMTNTAPTTFTGTAADTLSGVHAVGVALSYNDGPVQFWWNGVAWVAGVQVFVPATVTPVVTSGPVLPAHDPANVTWSFNVPLLTSGRQYTALAKSTDLAGNGSATAPTTFWYDTSHHSPFR